jgi:CO/xanthine dehydrogenase Mo-binding subunit
MSIMGTRVVRTEDPRLLTQGGVYTDDLRLPELDGAARVTFTRSPIAHARITGIDTAAALASPGVVAVLTAADLDDLPSGDGRPTTEPLLAADRVRYVGEAVAIVLTEEGYQGEDAAELVSVDYEPLPAVRSCSTGPAATSSAPAVSQPRRARSTAARSWSGARSPTSGSRRCRWRAARPRPAGRMAG